MGTSTHAFFEYRKKRKAQYVFLEVALDFYLVFEMALTKDVYLFGIIVPAVIITRLIAHGFLVV